MGIQEKEAMYGGILAPYLSDRSNLFVISSDFCHWGQRFRYQHYDQSAGEIHQSIRQLDLMGMGLIERLDHDGFAQYLKKYGNTICGRHPIGVFLGAVAAMRVHTNGMRMQVWLYCYTVYKKVSLSYCELAILSDFAADACVIVVKNAQVQKPCQHSLIVHQ